jgi:hypothetical protein
VNVRTKLSLLGALTILSLLIIFSYNAPAFSSDNKGKDVSGIAKQQGAGGVHQEGGVAELATGGAHVGDEPDQFDCQGGDDPGSCSEVEKDHGSNHVGPVARGDVEPPCDPEEEECEPEGDG